MEIKTSDLAEKIAQAINESIKAELEGSTIDLEDESTIKAVKESLCIVEGIWDSPFRTISKEKQLELPFKQ